MCMCVCLHSECVTTQRRAGLITNEVRPPRAQQKNIFCTGSSKISFCVIHGQKYINLITNIVSNDV